MAAIMIQDEFTERRDLSRQRKCQLRRMRDGLCTLCKKPAVTKNYCEEHRRYVNSKVLERLHKKFPDMRRSPRATTYRWREAKLAEANLRAQIAIVAKPGDT